MNTSNIAAFRKVFSKHRQAEDSEFARLEEELKSLSGLKCLQAKWSYPDVLYLDFESSPRDGQGQYLGINTARWVLLSHTGIAAHDRDPRDDELSEFEPLRGETVISAEARVQDLALCVTFKNGYRFLITARAHTDIHQPSYQTFKGS
jgi:hypothetical protein